MRRAAAHARAVYWGKVRFNPRTDLQWRWNEIQRQLGTERVGEGHGRRALLSGSVRQTAEAMIQLQGHRYGVVIASGEKIAATAGVGESTYWEIDRPALEGVGFFVTVEHGGGRMPGGDGRANVYMAPEAGVEPAPEPPRPPGNLDDRGQPRPPLASHVGESPAKGGREPPHT